MDNWQLISIAALSGGLLIWPLIKNGAGTLTAQNAVQLMNREKGVLIDVSDESEFAASHAISAKNIPLSQLDKQLASAVKNKALPVIFTCASGARATRAVGSAKKLGYARAQALSGGNKAWLEANMPMSKAA